MEMYPVGSESNLRGKRLPTFFIFFIQHTRLHALGTIFQFFLNLPPNLRWFAFEIFVLLCKAFHTFKMIRKSNFTVNLRNNLPIMVYFVNDER